MLRPFRSPKPERCLLIISFLDRLYRSLRQFTEKLVKFFRLGDHFINNEIDKAEQLQRNFTNIITIKLAWMDCVISDYPHYIQSLLYTVR